MGAVAKVSTPLLSARAPNLSITAPATSLRRFRHLPRTPAFGGPLSPKLFQGSPPLVFLAQPIPRPEKRCGKSMSDSPPIPECWWHETWLSSAEATASSTAWMPRQEKCCSPLTEQPYPNGGGAQAAPVAYVIKGKEFIVNGFGGNFNDRQFPPNPVGDAVIAFSLL